MGKIVRHTRMGVIAVMVIAAGFATTNQAGAVDTPVYNAPPGAGEVVETTAIFGPFNLDAVGGLRSEDENSGLVPRPPGSFGLKSASFDLVDVNGQPFGRHDVHLHHFVIGAVSQEDTACPGRSVLGFKAKPLIGSGMERTPLAFPDPYALPVASSDLWGATWHLMNMTGTPKTVYVKYKLGVQYGANDQNTRWVTPFWADSRTCPAGTTWDVPGNGGPGGVETNTKSWPMPFDGYIIGVGGHVHDGGISITTKHADGSLICENLATYASGMLNSISKCPMNDSITKGERISVTSRYDNSAPHPGVMGIAVLFLWGGSQGTPPPTTTTTTTAPPANDPAALGANLSPVALPSVAAAPVVASVSFAG